MTGDRIGAEDRRTDETVVASPTRFAASFRAWTAVSAGTLLAATSRSWLPQTVFPRVPSFEFAVGWSGGVDLLSFVATFCGLLLTFTPQRQRFGWFVFAVALALAAITDQHRLQPWAYQFGLLAVVFATTGDDDRQRQLARWLTIGIYLHSAHSKLDHAFLHGYGQTLVEPLLGFVGLSTKWWSETARVAVTALLPVGELAIAIGLLVPRTRSAAAWFAIVMHLALLVTFGPWALDHSRGVLLWNVFFVGQTLLLFTPWRPGRASPLVSSTSRHSALWIGEVVVALAVVAPCLEPFGLLDHWPAWSVYSARTERVVLELGSEAINDLPDDLRPFVRTPPIGESTIDVDRWSLETLGVPVYPQERFRMGVAAAIVRALPENADVRVLAWTVPDRFTGERRSRVLRGRDAIERGLEAYRLNAEPTGWPRRP